MAGLHAALAVLTVAVNLAAGMVGLVVARRPAGPAGSAPRGAALARQLVLTGQTLVVAVGLAGLLLRASGHRPANQLHAPVYGPFMLLAVLAAYGFRTSDGRHNTRVLAIAALVVAALGARAVQTGYGGN